MNEVEELTRVLRRLHVRALQDGWDTTASTTPRLVLLATKPDRPVLRWFPVEIEPRAWLGVAPAAVIDALEPILASALAKHWVGSAITFEAWSIAGPVSEPRDEETERLIRTRQLYKHPERRSVRSTQGVLASGTSVQITEFDDGSEPVVVSGDDHPANRASSVYRALVGLNDRCQNVVDDAEKTGYADVIGCPRAKTWMTPCISRDGSTALDNTGACVGCGEEPWALLLDLGRRYPPAREYFGMTSPDQCADVLTKMVRAYVDRDGT